MSITNEWKKLLEVNKMKKVFAILAMVLACFVGFGFSGETKCDASANVKYQPTNVYLYNGKSVIEGYFYNEGNTGATVTDIDISFTASDSAGNYIFSDSGNFTLDNSYAWVPAYGKISWKFTFHDSNCPGYNGSIRWHVDHKVHFRY